MSATIHESQSAAAFAIVSSTTSPSSSSITYSASGVVAPVGSPTVARSPKKPDVSDAVGARNAFRTILRACNESLTRILENKDDYILCDNSFRQFDRCLGDLWNLRKEFSDAYSEIVNMLQGLVVNRSAESFTEKEIDVLQTIVERLQVVERVDDDLANELTSLLLKGELDAFREID